MPTCGSNFDTLSTCDYHCLCAVYPPLPHHYSNIEICKNSLPSRSKHSHSQKSLTPIRLAHQKSHTLTPKNHLLTHSHHSCKPSRGRQLLCSTVARRLTHSHRATRFASLEVTGICMLEIVHANRAKEDQELLLLCSVVAGRLGFCFLIFEI